jgi:hypothetical protein
MEQLAACFGEVRLRVVDAITGQPIDGCRVNCFSPDEGGDGYSLTAQGTAVFERVPAGPLPISIMACGHGAISTHVSVKAGVVNDLGTFQMEPATSIRGSITDLTGRPFVRPLINLVPLDDYKVDQRLGSLWTGHYLATNSGCTLFALDTNDDGEFTALNVKPGRFLLRMDYGPFGRREWCIRPLVLDTTGGNIEGLRIQAQRGTAVQVRPDPDLPEDTWVRILDSDQNPVRDEDFSRSHTTTPLFLLPGSYRCIVYCNGVQHANLSLEVGGTPVSLVIPR